MCNPAMIIGAGAGAAAGIAGDREQQKALGAQVVAQNATKQNIIKQMNYDVVALNQEKRDIYDGAVTQLTTASINAYRNQGMIEAALGETGVEGRSVDRVLREVRGQDARVAAGIKESAVNQQRGNIYNQEMTVRNADSSIKGMPVIRGPSMFSRVLNVVSSTATGASAGSAINTGLAKIR